MIDKMTKYSFILLSEEKESFLQKLQELGLVDITRSSKAIDASSSAAFESIRHRNDVVAKLRAVTFEIDGPLPEVHDPVAESEVAFARIGELKARRSALSRELSSAEAWGEFDASKIATLSELGIKVRFYSVQAKKFDPAWCEKYGAVVVSEGKTIRFVTVSDEDPYFFPLTEMQAPQRSSSQIRAEMDLVDEEELSQQAIVLSCRSQIPSIEAGIEADSVQLDRYLASGAVSSAVEGLLTVATGFAPTEFDASLTEKFDEMGVVWFKEKAEVTDNPPIQLRNNRFVKMFEVLTDMYGRPAYDGFDPTPFISIFFLLFFAFCMGDAGYGLVLILVGLLLGKSEGMKDLSPLVITLGIGTVIIGFLFHTFFSIDIAEWSIFEPIRGIFLPSKIMGYDGTMVLSLVVGVFHICLAMVVKTIHETVNKGFLHSLGTWGWTLLIVGGVVVAALALGGIMDKTVTKWVVIALGVISAIGIFPLNDIDRNPLANTGLGLWDTYNAVTGLLGDTLSYLRLYALGLAGMMLGQVFNEIGLLILGDGSNIVLWLPFLLVVIFGHTLNIAMAALGAFVHPLRLNFLEFFKNSGYEGSGRNYNPLKN